MIGQKCGQMAGHGGVRFVRQPDLLESRLNSLARPLVKFAFRKKPVNQQPGDFFPVDFDRYGPANKLTSAAEYRNRLRLWPTRGENRLLGVSATMPE